VALSYQIAYIVGATTSVVPASSSGYYIRFKPNTGSTYTNLSYGATPYYSNTTYQTNY
jgi:hypothetical protein